jgi:hypothetical protein
MHVSLALLAVLPALRMGTSISESSFFSSWRPDHFAWIKYAPQTNRFAHLLMKIFDP